MQPGYFPVFFWSLLIFASFWGYGEALRRILARQEFADIGWGLTAAWGMSVVLALAGVLMALGVAVAPVLTGAVLLGALLAVLQFLMCRFDGKRRPACKTHFGMSDLMLWSLAVIAFASSIAWPHHIDPNDDLICYLMLPEKLLCTGTIIEPFSFQRAGTFGGQSILQALVMIVGAERNGHVPDRGFAMLMIFGMLLHATRGFSGQYAVVRFLLLFAFWFVPVPRISTNGAMTGGCLLLAMLETWRRTSESKTKDWFFVLPVGLLLAGASCIRPTFGLFGGCAFIFLTFANGWKYILSNKNLMHIVYSYLMPCVVAFIFLIPFMVVLYQSNGTPMIPPFNGFVSKDYQTFCYKDPFKDLAAVLAFFSAPESLCLLGLIAIAAIFPCKKEFRPILWASLIAGAVIVQRFGAMAYLDQYRLAYPVLLIPSLWILCNILKESNKTDSTASTKDLLHAPAAITAAGLICFIIINANAGGGEMREQLTGLPEQVKEVKPFFDPNLKKAYEQLQEQVPVGAKILTMVDASYWMNYRRNPMFSINAVGSSSPPPGIPFGKGPDALADYFKKLGIRYVIAVDFNNAVLLYTRKLWNENTRPEWVYSALWKPRFNDFMDNVDALASREGRLVATAGNARLIDLGD